MTKWILIGTHGHFGEELVRSAEMIAGKLRGVICCPLLEEMSFEDYMAEAERIVLKTSGEILCLVDLFGGTPSNVMAALSRKYPMQVVTGLNLPVLLEVCMNREGAGAKELAEDALAVLKESGRHINRLLEGGQDSK